MTTLTSKHCLFCFSSNANNVTKTSKNKIASSQPSDSSGKTRKRNGKVCRQFCKLVSRYLHLDSYQFILPDQTLKRKRTVTGISNACDKCVLELESFCRAYETFQRQRMEMSWRLEKISNVIRSVDRDREKNEEYLSFRRDLEDKLAHVTGGCTMVQVDNFRNNIVQKVKQKILQSFPRIKLVNVKPKEKEKTGGGNNGITNQRSSKKSKSRGKAEMNPEKSKSRGKAEMNPEKSKSRGKAEMNPEKSKSLEKASKMNPQKSKSRETAETNPEKSNSRETTEMKPGMPKSREKAEMNPEKSNSRETTEMKPGMPKSREKAEMKPRMSKSLEKTEINPKKSKQDHQERSKRKKLDLDDLFIPIRSVKKVSKAWTVSSTSSIGQKLKISLSKKSTSSTIARSESDNRQCKLCGYRFTRRASLDRHMLAVHKPRRRGRPRKSETQPSASMAKNDKDDPQDPSSKSAVVSSTTSKSANPVPTTTYKKCDKPLIYDHIKILGDGGFQSMYQCNICRRKFKTKSHIKYHKFCGAKAETEKPFNCKKCKRGFVTKGHYEYHLRRSHSKSPASPASKRKQKGVVNSDKKKDNTRSPTNNQKKPSPDQPDKAKSPVLSENDRNKSKEKVSGKERSFNCTICDQPFPKEYLLIRHIQSHTKEKPEFKCETCGKCFTNPIHLRSHKLTHVAVKHCHHTRISKQVLKTCYRCNFCGENFDQISSLKAHALIHLRGQVTLSLKPITENGKDNSEDNRIATPEDLNDDNDEIEDRQDMLVQLKKEAVSTHVVEMTIPTLRFLKMEECNVGEDIMEEAGPVPIPYIGHP